MSTIVQISDTHFGTERAPVVQALLEFVSRVRPDLVVLSGDITQRASRSQFDKAARFVADLAAPALLAIPGNHDIPLFNPVARLFFPYANYARAFGTELEPSFESSDLLVVTVNTTRAHRHAQGEVSARQIERVANSMRSARREQLRIVVTHQPVYVTRREDMENLLRGSERAVPRWCDAGVDLLLGGHIHLPYVHLLGEHFAQLERRVWAVQAGTAVSERVRGNVPNSLNLISHTVAGECCVERWDYDQGLSAFARVEAHRLTLDRAPLAADSD